MELIKQTKFGECLAACVAMLTGTSLSDAKGEMEDLLDKDGQSYYPLSEAIKYLAKYGQCYGMAIKPSVSRIGPKVAVFDISFRLDICNAILTVPSSTREDVLHVVVFDKERRMVLDPLKDEPQPLEDYGIDEWVAVYDVREGTIS